MIKVGVFFTNQIYNVHRNRRILINIVNGCNTIMCSIECKPVLQLFLKCGYKVGLCGNMMSSHWMSV
jgi:hypothetical protein